MNAADRASVPALIGRDIAAKCFHLMRRAERLEPSRRGEFFRLKLCSPDRRSTENGRRSPWAARTATSRTIARSRSRNVPPCALHPLCRGTKNGIYLTSSNRRGQFLRHFLTENFSRKLSRGRRKGKKGPSPPSEKGAEDCEQSRADAANASRERTGCVIAGRRVQEPRSIHMGRILPRAQVTILQGSGNLDV